MMRIRSAGAAAIAALIAAAAHENNQDAQEDIARSAQAADPLDGPRFGQRPANPPQAAAGNAASGLIDNAYQNQ